MRFLTIIYLKQAEHVFLAVYHLWRHVLQPIWLVPKKRYHLRRNVLEVIWLIQWKR